MKMKVKDLYNVLKMLEQDKQHFPYDENSKAWYDHVVNVSIAEENPGEGVMAATLTVTHSFESGKGRGRNIITQHETTIEAYEPENKKSPMVKRVTIQGPDGFN